MRARWIRGVGVLLAIAGVLAFQLVSNPSVSWSEREPFGWPSGEVSADLNGAVATYTRIVDESPMDLVHTVRIAAWAAQAYRLASGMPSELPAMPGSSSTDAGTVAFTEVVAVLLANPVPAQRMRHVTDTIGAAARQHGLLIAASVLEIAADDGYESIGQEIDPLSADTVAERFRFGQVLGDFPKIEPQWGKLTLPEGSSICEIPAPNLDNATFTNDIATARTLMTAVTEDPGVVALIRHWVSTAETPLSEAHTAWSSVLTDALRDAGTSRTRHDEILTGFFIDSHRAMVKAWEAKWRYRVASVGTLAQPEEPSAVYTTASSPAYPDELSVLAAVGSYWLTQANTDRIRVEYQGSLIRGGRTRVLPDVATLEREVSDLSIVTGLHSRRDVDAGLALGRCITAESR